MIEENIWPPHACAYLWVYMQTRGDMHLCTCIPYTKRKKGVEFGKTKEISAGREEPRSASLIPEIRGAGAQAPTVSSRRTGCSWRGQPTQSVKDTAQRVLRMRLPRRGVSLLSIPKVPFIFPEGHIRGSSSTESPLNQLPSILPGRQDRMPEPPSHTWLPSCPCP